MLKEIITALVVIAFFSALILPIDGASKSLSAYIWVPDEMLPGEKYYGLIVVDDSSDSDIIFDIITDNHEALEIITENVMIPKGKHHGILEIQTKGTGSADIFAIYKETLLEDQIHIVESANTPTKLDLILPSDLVNVLVDDNKHAGYIFLINDFDNPVTAKEPLAVTLTSNGEVLLPKESVTINAGDHYAKFIFEAMGEGSITATAPTLDPDEEDISVDPTGEIELNIKAAPDPIPTSSSGEIYFWLEKDGKPFLPPHDIKITISIDKSANLSFDSAIEGAIVLSEGTSVERRTTDPDAREVITRTNVQLARDSEREFILEQGAYYGKLQVYASFDPEGDISISGIAESINPKIDEETIRVFELEQIGTEKSNSDIATITKIFAYPDPAYDKVEIIVSSQSGNGPVLEQDDEEFVVFTNNKLETNPTITKISPDENYAIVTATVVDTGNAEIFAERNEAESDEIDIEIKGKHIENPELEIVSLPIIYGTEQDLFLIISTHDKITTEPDSQDEGSLVSITSRPAFEYEAIRESESVLTVHGTVANLLKDKPEVHVASNAFTVSETLDVHNPSRKKIESLHPANVYPHEPFPIINYVTDLEKNPIKKANLKVSSGADMGIMGDLVYFNETGTHGIIFYDKNSVPIEYTITVKGASKSIQQQIEAEKEQPTIFTYEIIVENGDGSGTYEEGTDVTISAEPVIDDMFIIKKKLAGWENLPYTESTVTFEVDEDIETKPIYQEDLTMLFTIIGPAAGIGAVVILKKRKRNNNENKKSDEDTLLEELLGK